VELKEESVVALVYTGVRVVIIALILESLESQISD